MPFSDFKISRNCDVRGLARSIRWGREIYVHWFSNFIHDKSKSHLKTRFSNINSHQIMIVVIAISVQDEVPRL